MGLVTEVIREIQADERNQDEKEDGATPKKRAKKDDGENEAVCWSFGPQWSEDHALVRTSKLCKLGLKLRERDFSWDKRYFLVSLGGSDQEMLEQVQGQSSSDVTGDYWL